MGTFIDVPAHSFSVMGRGSTQEPPCRFLHFHCAVASTYVGWRFICRFLEFGFIYVRYFRKTYTLFAKYNHEIYSESNYLGLLHVTGLSSWWVSSKIQFCLVCGWVCVFFSMFGPEMFGKHSGLQLVKLKMWVCCRRPCWPAADGEEPHGWFQLFDHSAFGHGPRTAG